ncbi:hypothetical protein [Marinomonas ostreistagni]|uniref:Uncharacterized protein n=1 Tax=Marinomonas ostreistagni TaxID=359209 RepID=A0ABS0ZBG8_9GAMM|nr:hypothetical protein [Marinomonas ostreistagni]MBJ7550758.1 hypothetical protein [Marinomonas ostreistagni]
MEVKDYIGKIELHLASLNSHQLIYAALDCRLAIERFVYNRLEFHSERHSAKLLFKNWQPHSAMRTLTLLEPDANKSFTLHMKEESERGEKEGFKLIGSHEGIDDAILNKKYHSLGSYLHLRKDMDSEKLRTLINECLDELKRLVIKKFECNLANIVKADCLACGQEIHINEKSIPNLKEIWCTDPNCNTKHFVKDFSQEKKLALILDATVFKCASCSAENLILNTKVKEGFSFKCTECHSKNEIIRKVWEYGVRETQQTALPRAKP